MSLLHHTGLPGMGPGAESVENVFLWGPNTWYLTKSILIDSAAVDAGNTPTTDLRAGLVMGIVTATKRYKQYVPGAADGTEVAEGVLFHGTRMIRPIDGIADHQLGVLVVAGAVKAAGLFGLDAAARADFFGRFIIDDDLRGNRT